MFGLRMIEDEDISSPRAWQVPDVGVTGGNAASALDALTP